MKYGCSCVVEHLDPAWAVLVSWLVGGFLVEFPAWSPSPGAPYTGGWLWLGHLGVPPASLYLGMVALGCVGREGQLANCRSPHATHHIWVRVKGHTNLYDHRGADTFIQSLSWKHGKTHSVEDPAYEFMATQRAPCALQHSDSCLSSGDGNARWFILNVSSRLFKTGLEVEMVSASIVVQRMQGTFLLYSLCFLGLALGS